MKKRKAPTLDMPIRCFDIEELVREFSAAIRKDSWAAINANELKTVLHDLSFECHEYLRDSEAARELGRIPRSKARELLDSLFDALRGPETGQKQTLEKFRAERGRKNFPVLEIFGLVGDRKGAEAQTWIAQEWVESKKEARRRYRRDGETSAANVFKERMTPHFKPEIRADPARMTDSLQALKHHAKELTKRGESTTAIRRAVGDTKAARRLITTEALKIRHR